jgi:hypothetical protein
VDNIKSRIGLVLGAVAALIVLGATGASAAADTAVVTPITDAAASFKDTFMAVAVVGLGIGASLYALRRGWKLVKGFSR